MWKSLVSRAALALPISAIVAGCASSEGIESDAPATESAAATSSSSFPKEGATYEVTTAFQPGVTNTLKIGANGSYQFTEQAVDSDSVLKCSGTYAALSKGRIFVGHLQCEGPEGRFTQVLEMPAGKTSLCDGVQVEIRSSLFALQEPIPATLTEKCEK